MVARIPIYYQGSGPLSLLIFVFIVIMCEPLKSLIAAFVIASALVFVVGRLLNHRLSKAGQPTHSFMFVEFEYCGLFFSGVAGAVVLAFWVMHKLGVNDTNPINIGLAVMTACMAIIVCLLAILFAFGKLLGASAPTVPEDKARRSASRADELRRIKPNTYLVRGEFKLRGPFTKVELRHEYRRGAISSETKCWRQGSKEWVPVGKVLQNDSQRVR